VVIHQVYIWKDTKSVSATLRLEGQVVVQGYLTGAAGHWERLGPWRVTINDGPHRPHR
jgi:hypothetical protein